MSASTPPLTEAQIVLALRAAGCVFAEDEAAVILGEARSASEVDRMVERRTRGEPLEVILGWAEFCGLRIGIDPGVFVPRRRTEFLVSLAVQQASASAVVVDLCCGSGALGLAVRASVPGARLSAADIDPAAVACARRNLASVGDVYEGDLFRPLPETLRGSIELLLVNAPYVPSADVHRMPPEARLHEPLVALDGGPDGLDVHRRVAAEASDWLAPGGCLLIETSEGQADVAAALLEQGGLRARVERSEDEDATVVLGVQPIR